MKQNMVYGVACFIYSLIYFFYFSRSLYEGGIIIQPYYILGIPLGMGIMKLVKLIIKNIYGSFKENSLRDTIIMIAIFIAVRFGMELLLKDIIDEYYISGYPNLWSLFEYLNDY